MALRPPILYGKFAGGWHHHIPGSHRHLSPLPLQQPSHSSRQSRSLRRHSEPQETDKRSVPTHRSPRRRKISARHLRQSSRDFSPPRDRARSKDFCSLRGRESSITLKSASPIVRSDIMTRTMTTSTTLTIPLLDHLDHVHHHVGKNNTPPTMRLPMGIPSPGSLHNGKTGMTGENCKPHPPTNSLLGNPLRLPTHIRHPLPIYLGSPLLQLTPSCCSSLCGSTIQTSNCLFHLHSTSPTAPRNAIPDQTLGSVRGPSSLPAGHMQISLQDDSKSEWIKWVKFTQIRFKPS